MDLLQDARQYWSQRAPRERRLLTAGGVFLGVVVLYLLLIDPAVTGIARLQRQLAHARSETAELEALVAEAKRLRGLPPVAASGAADARSAIGASLASAGMAPVRSTPLANGDLRLEFVNVPFSRWSAWLAASERTLGVHAVAVSVKATATPGNTDVDVSLRLPRI